MIMSGVNHWTELLLHTSKDHVVVFLVRILLRYVLHWVQLCYKKFKTFLQKHGGTQGIIIRQRRDFAARAPFLCRICRLGLIW